MREVFIGAVILGTLLSHSAFSAHLAQQSRFKKVFIIILENTNYDDALKQAFLSKLTQEGALLSNYTAPTHPSFPNYLALVAGTTFDISSNSAVDLDEKHVGDLLEAKGKSWTTYAEDYPGNCFLGAASGTYARKHVPFLSFQNVSKNRARCARVVGSASLDQDIADGTLADYSLYIPGMENDGHDTDVGFADRWLEKAFKNRFHDPRFMKDMLVVVTFDEGTLFSSNQVFTVLLGDSVKAGAKSTQPYDHYSLLKTIEENLGLGTLGKNDLTAKPITDIWN